MNKDIMEFNKSEIMYISNAISDAIESDKKHIEYLKDLGNNTEYEEDSLNDKLAIAERIRKFVNPNNL